MPFSAADSGFLFHKIGSDGGGMVLSYRKTTCTTVPTSGSVSVYLIKKARGIHNNPPEYFSKSKDP